ncbi:HAD family hydrolase [Streptomyces sp. DSM 116496]|uniref:HAD family hydrolase n=1 Tax=Streptomyces stoeckheimensis TaxID=3344656 RepID=UPI0038B369A4
MAAVDGRAVALIGIADAPRETAAAAVSELHALGVEVVMVTGDNQATAERIAQRLGIDTVIAIGAGTDVAIETADLVLMRSDPLDVPTALRIGRGTLRTMRQNLGWAIGYNAIALPIAAGVFEPATGLILRPEIAAPSMYGSSIIVALNALALKRLPRPAPTGPAGGGVRGGE